MNNAQSAIDSCPYLHLASITEPEEGGLRLLVQEARAELTNLDMLTKELLPEVGALLASTTPIQHTTGCQVFEIHWPDYIAYAVENESYARGQPRNLEAKGRLILTIFPSFRLHRPNTPAPINTGLSIALTTSSMLHQPVNHPLRRLDDPSITPAHPHHNIRRNLKILWFFELRQNSKRMGFFHF
jgi:hypothetical protein